MNNIVKDGRLSSERLFEQRRLERIAEEELRAQRLTGIGGSDAGAIAGVNPYKSALDVYFEKLQLKPEPEENERMYWGKVHEAAIAQRWLELNCVINVMLKSPSALIRHYKHKFMIAHPDRLIVNESNDAAEGVLEIKTADQRQRIRWGAPGTDEVPEEYLVQVQHYMAVTGLRYAEIAVLFGGNELLIYRVPRNDMLIEYLIKIEQRFWNEHVLARVEPPADGNAHAKSLLNDLYRKDDGTEMVADENLARTVKAYFDACSRIDAIEAEKSMLSNRIKQEMKTATILRADDIVVSWKKAKDSEVVDYKGIIESVGIAPDIVKKFTSTKTGSRRFLVRKVDE